MYIIFSNPKAKNTWIAGLVKCGNCGYTLVQKNYVKKNISCFLCSHKMNDNLCCGCGTIHADEFGHYILQKIKEKLIGFKEFELAVENEINETFKKVASASEAVTAYFNANGVRVKPYSKNTYKVYKIVVEYHQSVGNARFHVRAGI